VVSSGKQIDRIEVNDSTTHIFARTYIVNNLPDTTPLLSRVLKIEVVRSIIRLRDFNYKNYLLIKTEPDGKQSAFEKERR
jgi:hypothetical protein